MPNSTNFIIGRSKMPQITQWNSVIQKAWLQIDASVSAIFRSFTAAVHRMMIKS